MTEYRVELTDEQAQSLVNLWTDFHHRTEDPMHGISGKAAIRDAIRAQMPKPRMAEPGRGGLVIAGARSADSERRLWFRNGTPESAALWTDQYGIRLMWESLHDPQPVDGAS